MFTASCSRQHRGPDETQGDSPHPARESSRIPPDQQYPSHVKRRDGVARTLHWKSQQNHTRRLCGRERVKRKVSAKQVNRTAGWHHVVAQNSDRPSYQKRRHHKQSFAAQLTQLLGIDEGQWQWQSDVEHEAESPERLKPPE